jgi:hypothetical protein
MPYRQIQTMPQLHKIMPGASATCTETAPDHTTEAQARAYHEETLAHLRQEGIRGGVLRLEEIDSAGSVLRVISEVAL